MTQHISYLVLGQRLHEPISSSAARHDYIQRRPFPRVFGYKGPSNPCCCIKPYRCKSPPVEAYEDCAARVDRGQCSAGGAVALARLQTRDYIESGCRTGVQDRSAKPLPSHASSPSWTNPSTNSRLLHLSTWKDELRLLVGQAQENVESGEFVVASKDETLATLAGDRLSMRGAEITKEWSKSPGKDKGKGKATSTQKTIMHCDFDCFFVSAGLVDRPEVRGKPAVVCHSQGVGEGAASTSEIASCSYEARAKGIKNGMR